LRGLLHPIFYSSVVSGDRIHGSPYPAQLRTQCQLSTLKR
jgi:hypothetical protein